MSRPQTIGIVGAGIIGCLIAREIVARAPGARLVVLDQDGVGCGASRRSAGLHFPRGASERVRRMAAYSQTYYERLRWADSTVPIYPLGMSVVAARTPAAELRQVYLDRAQLTATEGVPHPAVRVPAGAGSWTGTGCQVADVYALAHYLARQLRAQVNFREGVRVSRVQPAADRVTVALGTGEELEVDRLVLAPGPWVAAPAWRSLVAPLGLRVKRVVALHLEDGLAECDRVVIFQDEDAFLVPVVHRGYWLFSYTCQEWDIDPDAPVGGLSPEHLDQARHTLDRYAPALADRCTAGRVFCDAYSPDRQPVVRAIDDEGRVVFAGAANGSGYRLGPAIAAETADLLQLGPEGASRDH